MVRKLCRLGGYLAARPAEIPRYLRDRLPGRQDPAERELPWYAYPAIAFLEGWLRPETGRDAFAASAYAQALDQALDQPPGQQPGGGYDLIAVDGSEPWPGEPLRPVCFAAAERRITPGGVVLLDDSWRYPELLRDNRARAVRNFVGTGPCRPGVTSTAAFFY